MARQLWDPGVNWSAVQDYFSAATARRTRCAASESLEQMLGNVTELKWAGRPPAVGRKSSTTHLRYERTTTRRTTPGSAEILEASRRCRQILDDVLRRRLPERCGSGCEDERGFTWRAHPRLLRRVGPRLPPPTGREEAEARQAFREASKLAGLLKADTTSALHSPATPARRMRLPPAMPRAPRSSRHCWGRWSRSR